MLWTPWEFRNEIGVFYVSLPPPVYEEAIYRKLSRSL